DEAFNGENKVAFETIPACIDAVKSKDLDIGVVPLENAIEGTDHLILDYLVHQVRLPIVEEIVVPIRQHLLVNKTFTGPFSDITQIHSHSHAIEQYYQYIHQELSGAKIKHTTSTARAAEIVSSSDKPIAAIGNVLAAEEYGVDIMKKNIHDFPNNH